MFLPNFLDNCTELNYDIHMHPKPIVLTFKQMMVERKDLMLCLCPVCLREVNWRHNDVTHQMHSQCCGFVYQAYPANKSMKVYRIDGKPADFTNVYWLRREGAAIPARST